MNNSINTRILALGLVTLMAVGCQNRKVQRVDPNETIDLSGRWNDTDSKMTANAMIEQILTGPWLANHLRDNSNDKPVVVVGIVRNKSTEHITTETFCKDLERSFITSQKVRLVQAN